MYIQAERWRRSSQEVSEGQTSWVGHLEVTLVQVSGGKRVKGKGEWKGKVDKTRFRFSISTGRLWK
ncbi:hypothetical protein E2C01_094232 [Portunus trituberculatus]|uniref:Uncharacterized protein n=1 Tax=Portunus trituberculatus TaxID=210409 RepID=A0A5B7K092_PORTR|nr:hypothetical protein [Portunus trituberculatus]